MTEFEVLRPGPLSLFQDLGRPGYAALGLGQSGAADRASFLAANRLLGNPDDAAAIECVLGGLSLRSTGDCVVAVTGAAAPLTVDGRSMDHGVEVRLDAGQVLKLAAPRAGLRSYLAVRGGFDVAPVLGSRSTDTLSGVGPPPLRRGDTVPIAAAATTAPAVQRVSAQQSPGAGTTTLRAIAGPRDDWFTSPTDLAVGEWTVSPHSNRVGIRLDRADGDDPSHSPALRRTGSRELPSEGIALGSVQVPPSGQPVLFLADHPVTGGYPVVAVVPLADVDLAAQVRPGQRVRFRFEPAADADSAGSG